MERETDIKKKNNSLWIVLGIVLVVGGVIIGTVMYSNTPAQRYIRQLKVAERYLEEMNYEQAIVAYQAAIEIDPIQPEAYVGMADAYIGQKKYDEAYELLLEGYEKTRDERLNNKIIEEEANIREIKAIDILEKIAKNVKKENWENVWEYMESLEFADIKNQMKSSENCRIWKTEEGQVGIYKNTDPMFRSMFGDYVIYVGDYYNDQRQGKGYYFCYQDVYYYHAYGEWEKDKPNGYQEVTGGFATDGDYSKLEGLTIDGLWDGTIKETYIANPVDYEINFVANRGRLVIEEEGTFNDSEGNVVKAGKTGRIILALDDIAWTNTHGIIGFSETFIFGIYPR